MPDPVLPAAPVTTPSIDERAPPADPAIKMQEVVADLIAFRRRMKEDRDKAIAQQSSAADL